MGPSSRTTLSQPQLRGKRVALAPGSTQHSAATRGREGRRADRCCVATTPDPEDLQCQLSLSTISPLFPSLPDVGADARIRPVRSITTAPPGFEGEGFPVRRAFAGVNLADLDPFIHMDQMGEVDYGPGEPRGTAWHPHRGFETVTYMIDGMFEHKDSTGGGGLITNGDTQWMTAGGGILHIERPPESLVDDGRSVPRHPALGQPAVEGQDGRAPLPGHPKREGHVAVLTRRWRARAGHRRRRRRPCPGRASPTHRSRSFMRRSRRPGSSSCRGRSRSTHSCTP